jgi:ABC-type lipoprotein export system ATPase subunit
MSIEAINQYRRTKVGFVWQQGARNLIPYLTALENVRLPIIIAAQPWSMARPHVEALLDSVGLSARKHHRLSELSGGEQQRVAIAVALANNPILLLADEPTGEVDTTTAAGIYQVLKDLNQQFGLTTIIVSHDVGIAQHVDRVVSIHDGKTSSETVRLSVQEADAAFKKGGTADLFEEVVLLDSAGRLQVPREYLDQYHIQGRVNLELLEEGILIRPAKTGGPDLSLHTQASEIRPVAEPVEQKGILSWWKNLRGGGRGTK